MELKGAIDGLAFAAFVPSLLVPQIHQDDIAILENNATRLNRAALSAIEAAGAHVLFLPAYSLLTSIRSSSAGRTLPKLLPKMFKIGSSTSAIGMVFTRSRSKGCSRRIPIILGGSVPWHLLPLSRSLRLPEPLAPRAGEGRQNARE
jgi:hypothetical protein